MNSLACFLLVYTGYQSDSPSKKRRHKGTPGPNQKGSSSAPTSRLLPAKFSCCTELGKWTLPWSGDERQATSDGEVLGLTAF